MQKINREALREALEFDAKCYPHAKCNSVISQAAAILLEITGEDWEVPEGMVAVGNAALDHHTFPDRFSYKALKVMLRELVE